MRVPMSLEPILTISLELVHFRHDSTRHDASVMLVDFCAALGRDAGALYRLGGGPRLA